MGSSARTYFRQVNCLLYKTYLQRRRSVKWTLCEVLAPILLAMLLMAVPEWAGLNMEIYPYQSNQDYASFPIASPNSQYGLFIQLYNTFDGSSCWCKTLAIIADDPATATMFQSFMLQEYASLESYYYSTQNRNFTNYGYIPGYSGESDKEWVECSSWNTDTFFRIFKDESELDAFVTASDYGYTDPNRVSTSKGTDRICGAVVFDQNTLSSVEPEISLRFNITWNNGARYETFLTKINIADDTRGLDRVAGQNSARKWYMQQGFVGLQIFVERFLRNSHLILKTSNVGGSMLDSTSEVANWAIYPFPAYEYAINEALELLLNFQFILLFCFATSVALTIGRIVREREQKLREYMRVMGMFDMSYYTTWLISSGITWLIVAFGVTSMQFLYAFKNSSFGIVLMFNYLFGLAAMSFSFFISAFCTRERLGSIIGFFLFFLLQQVKPPNYSSDLVFNACSLLPPSAYLLGLRTMFALQSQGQWVIPSTIGTKIYGYSLEQCMAMLVVDVVFWWLLYYYVDQVNPFLFGAKRVWYFPLSVDYWKDVFGISHVGVGGSIGPRSPGSPSNGSKFEKVTDPVLLSYEANSRCIKTVDLSKKFGPSFYAVKNLNLTMYANEIHCLLGHNGAGKTTTFSMLSGMLDQTGGTISAFGMDVPRDLAEVRKSMGVCPQHSALWDELTVMEHMRIFAGIRGLEWSKIRSSVHSLIADVGLANRANFQTQALSGGMKRKLSVGIAFVGDPKIVFLDEPTSGMDPYARRSTWELLKRRRSPDRVICLTTHYMDEADVLGDRISIMSHGELECVGSSMFLKKLYGCGYLLSMVKETVDTAMGQDDMHGGVNESNESILLYVQKYVHKKSVRIVSSVGRELILEINDKDPGFTALVEALDREKGSIGVLSFGVSVTNIEEVFLKVAELHDLKQRSSSKSLKDLNQAGGHPTEESKNNTPLQSTFWNQLWALLLRRVYYGYRDRQLFFMQIVLPFVILVAGIGFMVAAVTYVPSPITLTVDKLNPGNADFNIYQATTAGAAGLVTEYCAKGGLSLSTTQCTELSSDLSTAASFYDFQEFLLHNETIGGSPWTYTSDAFFAFFGLTWVPNWNYQVFGLWQNLTGIHTTALAALSQFNAWAAEAAATPVQLTVVNDPLPFTAWEQQNRDTIEGTVAGLMIVLALIFLPTAIISFVVMEREKEVKNQLLISGVTPKAYWLSNFLFDSAVASISALLAIIVFGIYNLNMFNSGKTLPGTFALLLLFGPASTSFAYVCSYFFTRQFAAQAFMAVSSLILGNVLVLVAYVLQFIPTSSCSSCSSVGNVIIKVGRFFPPFALGSGFYRLGNYVYAMNMSLTSSDLFGGCVDSVVPFSGDTECLSGIGDDLFFLGITAIMYLVIAIGVDELGAIPGLSKLFVVKKSSSGADVRNAAVGEDMEDEAVVAERQRVSRLDKKSQLLYCNQICKIFKQSGTSCASSKKVFAVKSVSFASNKGEVFGLLGNNGAGKTTTFKMLCGLYCPSGGEIYINGMDATMKMADIRKIIGYCAQFDALWDLLTTKEHLELYAKLRGYGGPELIAVVDNKMVELDLTEYANSRAGSLSGGNKRKLSVAMALIGEPQLVFLDEPSCGMDPFARRSMWKIIQQIAENRKHSLIILTTHSMEEAEALCSNVAIQVDGRFRCLGSCQQIKSKYGDGYEVTFRVSNPSSEQSSTESILKEWNQTSALAANSDITLENCAKICEKTFGQLARMNHPAFGIKSMLTVNNETTTTVNLLEFANWLYRDNIFKSLKTFLMEHFSENQIELIELHGLNMKVKLIGNLAIGSLFKLFNEAKAQIGIDDYQISQTTLEQIFNKFAATAVKSE